MGLIGLLPGGRTKVQFLKNSISILELDASLKETHSRESPPTEFPVEDGTTVSDHIIIKPFSLEITGIISDTPIGGLGGLLTQLATTAVSSLTPPTGVIAASAGVAVISALAGSKSPSVSAYGQLLNLQAQAEPFDVITSLRRYPNMWIKSISVPRDSENGKVLMFTVSLTQLILVSPQSVNIAVFANAALSSSQADLGENGLQGINGFSAGLKAATSLVGGG